MCPAAQYDTGRALPSGRRRTHSKSPALLCSQQSLTALLAELTARGGARARAELELYSRARALHDKLSRRGAQVWKTILRASRVMRLMPVGTMPSAPRASRAQLPCAAGDPDPALRAGQSFVLCGGSLRCGFLCPTHPPYIPPDSTTPPRTLGARRPPRTPPGSRYV